jgi:hypothetical protein
MPESFGEAEMTSGSETVFDRAIATTMAEDFLHKCSRFTLYCKSLIAKEAFKA